MIFQYRCYREFLKAVLIGKEAEDPAYNLQAMAADFEMSPQALYKVLNGHDPIGIQRVNSIAEKLRLPLVEKNYFSTLVQLDYAATLKCQEELWSELEKLTPRSAEKSLDLETFRLISEWYYYPILELCSMPQLKPDIQLIARFLEISYYKTWEAVIRLIKLGMLTENSDGTFNRVHERLFAASATPNTSLKHFHRQMLSKATTAVDEQGHNEMIIGTETMAFDIEDLRKAELIIDECFKKLTALGKKGKNQTPVYHLGIQFFDLHARSDKPEREDSDCIPFPQNGYIN